MKTHFHIKNKDDIDYLKLSIGDKIYYLNNDITIEHDDCESLDLEIEYIHPEDYIKIKIKNKFLRFLVWLPLSILGWILSVLIFVMDNQGGMRHHRAYKNFNPFTYKKSFYITSPSEKTININYIAPRYDKTTNVYSLPSIELVSEGIVNRDEKAVFSGSLLKRDWRTYYIPFFTTAMAFLALFIVLSLSAFKTDNLFASSTTENFWLTIGFYFVLLLLACLFVATLIIAIKSLRMRKEVIDKNSQLQSDS